MDLSSVLFWVFAVVIVVASLLVVGQRDIVHSALALIVVFAMAAGIYVLLSAEFIAIVQILIYVGAVTILILFALMLTRIGGHKEATNPSNKLWPIAAIICVAIGAVIIYAFSESKHNIQSTIAASQVATQLPNNVVRIGQLLYSPNTPSYVLPFEIASLVLLVAIIGAIVIGRED
jgi:NADH:ubiquinone oxidoreductase subunit 6 (subunit J)